MKTINKFLLLGTVALCLQSCNQEEDVAPIGSMDEYPVATITIDEASSALLNTTLNETEATQIVYNVSLDRPFHGTGTVSFGAQQVGGTADSDDYVVTPGTVPAFTTETQVIVTILDDAMPEELETLELEIGAFTVDDRYEIISENPVMSVSIIDPNLEVSLNWDTTLASDLDMLSANEALGPWAVQWTGDVPEMATMIWAEDPDGNYVLTIDPYSVESGEAFAYTWTMNDGNGGLTVIEGVFDYPNRDTEYQTTSYGGTNWYNLVQVTKTGATYQATSLEN